MTAASRFRRQRSQRRHLRLFLSLAILALVLAAPCWMIAGGLQTRTAASTSQSDALPAAVPADALPEGTDRPATADGATEVGHAESPGQDQRPYQHELIERPGSLPAIAPLPRTAPAVALTLASRLRSAPSQRRAPPLF